MTVLGPQELLRLGPLVVTDTVVTTLALSALLVGGVAAALATRRGRLVLEVLYEELERIVDDMVAIDARPLVPLILTQWLFILAANLAGLVPGVAAPTADLAVTTALALIAFLAGHVYAFRAHGLAYLKNYLRPNPLLLPFNIIGEISRTLALALRLFGNMMSGQLIGAILVWLAGLLVPVPLLLLSVLTSVVQAYIFGVLTLVFTASAMQVVGRVGKGRRRRDRRAPPEVAPPTALEVAHEPQ